MEVIAACPYAERVSVEGAPTGEPVRCRRCGARLRANLDSPGPDDGLARARRRRGATPLALLATALVAALCGVAGCIPAPAPASPADEAGRPLTLSAIYTAVAVDAETATAAPRRTIEARAAARRRPATGEYLTWAQGHGRGSLHVDNGSERDLVLRLVDVDSRDVPCIVYVRAGEGFTVGSLPPGAYEVRYGLGTGYDPESGLFDKDANYARMVGSVTFAPADAVDYAQYTLTLDDRGGYGDTRPLGATEFVG